MVKEEKFEKDLDTDRYLLKIKTRIGPTDHGTWHYYGEAYWKDTMKYAGHWSITARDMVDLRDKINYYDPIRRPDPIW